jgi:hypothetical protein
MFASVSGKAQFDAGSAATATVSEVPPGPVSACSYMLYGAATKFGQAALTLARAAVELTEAIAQTAATAHATLSRRPRCG